MKKNTRTKLSGALLVANGFACILWAALRICGDNLAQPNTNTAVSEKQAIVREFCQSDPEDVALGFFGAITAIGGFGLLNKSKEK